VAEFNALMRDARIVPPVEPNALLQVPTQADAWTQNVQAATDWMERERQISRDRGLWTGGSVFEGGHPTQAGVVDAVKQLSENALLSTSAPGIRGYHAGPHSFDRFDNSKIGTGVGAQPYGRGHYLAGNEDVARVYRGRDGHMYEANIKAEPHQLIDWDQPFAAQGDVGKKAHEITRDLLTKAYQKTGSADFAEKLMNTGGGLGKPFSPDMTPGDAILWAQAAGVDPAVVSEALRGAGIPGLKYSDAAVAGGPAKQNYVVFDADTIEILRKYGIAGLMAGGGAAVAGSQQQ